MTLFSPPSQPVQNGETSAGNDSVILTKTVNTGVEVAVQGRRKRGRPKKKDTGSTKKIERLKSLSPQVV